MLVMGQVLQSISISIGKSLGKVISSYKIFAIYKITLIVASLFLLSCERAISLKDGYHIYEVNKSDGFRFGKDIGQGSISIVRERILGYAEKKNFVVLLVSSDEGQKNYYLFDKSIPKDEFDLGKGLQKKLSLSAISTKIGYFEIKKISSY